MNAVTVANPRELVIPYVRALAGHAAIVSTEEELVRVARRLFDEAGLPYISEHRLNARDRIDMFADGLGIEFKIESSVSDLLRQLDRYASCPEIRALLLVTTRRRLANLPASLRDVPLVTVCMGGAF